MCPPSDVADESAEDASSKPYHRGRIWRKSLSLLAGVAAGATVLAVLRPSRVRVEGQSMAPTLLPGDVLIAVHGLKPRRGDIAVVRHPDGFEIVKRISAGPGDEAMPGWTLSADQWLVIGDNREESDDSRSFGALTGDQVIGRVVWPRGL